jgi:hypothetical protein
MTNACVSPLPQPSQWQLALAQRYPQQVVGFAQNARLNTVHFNDAVYHQSKTAAPGCCAFGIESNALNEA